MHINPQAQHHHAVKQTHMWHTYRPTARLTNFTGDAAREERAVFPRRPSTYVPGSADLDHMI